MFLNDNPGLKDHYRSRISKLEGELELITGQGFTGFGKEFHNTVQEYISILEKSAERNSTD